MLVFETLRSKALVLFSFSFFQAILVKERRRLSRIPHSLSYNIVQLEYLCPLCESLSNTVIPLVPALHSLVTDRSVWNRRSNVQGAKCMVEVIQMFSLLTYCFMRWHNIILCFSDLCDVNLSFGDWLDGLQKTVKNATKQESSSASKG